MPSLVQVSISICGKTLRWLISFSFGNRSSSGVLICVRSRIRTSASVSFSRSASLSTSWTWSFQIVTSWPFEFREAIEGAHRVEIIVEDGNLHDAPLSDYFTASSSTSNISVAFGGITPPAPRAP